MKIVIDVSEDFIENLAIVNEWGASDSELIKIAWYFIDCVGKSDDKESEKQ